MDGGAYLTLSPVGAVARRAARGGAVPLPRGPECAAGVVATNHPPHGAFRGFGAAADHVRLSLSSRYQHEI